MGNKHIRLLLDAHLFDSGPDFLRAAAQRDLLQQVEVLCGKLLPLHERSQDLPQGRGTRVSLRPPLGRLKTTSLSFFHAESRVTAAGGGRMGGAE